MTRAGTGRISDIEVLRAAAIVFTLCSHLVWGLLPRLGAIGHRIQSDFRFWSGVDLFFAISGFVIVSSLLKVLEADRAARGSRPTAGREFLHTAIPFWIRRVFRLLPTAWLWLGITLVLAATFNSHHAFGPFTDNLHEARAAFFDLANLYYFQWFAHHHLVYGVLGAFWSLSLEEQFYLLLPPLLFFVNRRLLIVGLLAAFLAQAVTARPDGFDPVHTSLLWFVRTDAIILGVLIAFWKSHWTYRLIEPRFLRRAPWSLAVLATCFLLLAALPASRELARFSTGLIAIVSGVLVLVASYDRNYILRPSRLKTVLVWLGTRSYSIYVIHAIGHAFMLECKRSLGVPEGGVASELITLASLPFILALSELNYRLVEARFRRVGRRLAGRLKPAEKTPALWEEAQPI